MCETAPSFRPTASQRRRNVRRYGIEYVAIDAGRATFCRLPRGTRFVSYVRDRRLWPKQRDEHAKRIEKVEVRGEQVELFDPWTRMFGRDDVISIDDALSNRLFVDGFKSHSGCISANKQL